MVADSICVYLKYNEQNNPAITHLQRISKPGCRAYVKAKNILEYVVKQNYQFFQLHGA